MYIEFMIMWTWRRWLSEIEVTPEDHNQASMEMHLAGIILWTWRAWLCKFWHILEGWECELCNKHGGSNQVKSDMYVEKVELGVVKLDAVNWEDYSIATGNLFMW